MPATSDPADELPTLRARSELTTFSDAQPRLKGRWILEAPSDGWSSLALSEWELTAAGISDRHFHDEVNFVLEGELHVRVGDTLVVSKAGDTVTVPAGSTGIYEAPEYARMLAIYGPNPSGAASTFLRYWETENAAGPGPSQD